jgi:hypothetical protein
MPSRTEHYEGGRGGGSEGALTHEGLGSEAGARADEAAEVADPRHGRGRRDPPASGRGPGRGGAIPGVPAVGGGGAHGGRGGSERARGTVAGCRVGGLTRSGGAREEDPVTLARG